MIIAELMTVAAGGTDDPLVLAPAGTTGALALGTDPTDGTVPIVRAAKETTGTIIAELMSVAAGGTDAPLVVLTGWR